MRIPAFQVYRYHRWYQGHSVLEGQSHKMSSTNTSGRRSNVRIPSLLIKHQIRSLWVHCIEPFCCSKDSRFVSGVLLEHLPWGMDHRKSGLRRVNKADGKQLRDLRGHYERGEVPTCHLYQYLFFFFFFFSESQECELVKKNLMIFSLDNLCLIFSFTSGTSIWILLDLYTLAPLFLWVSWSYFVLHRILILQSNKVKESQLLNSKISVAMDGRERTGRLLPKHENSIL